MYRPDCAGSIVELAVPNFPFMEGGFFMPPKSAVYHRLMVMVGLRNRFDAEVEHAPEAEDSGNPRTRGSARQVYPHIIISTCKFVLAISVR